MKAPAARHRTKKIDFHFQGVSHLTLQSTVKEEIENELCKLQSFRK
jgi:hypothetical protein